MESSSKRSKTRSLSALIFLSVIGVALLLFGLITLTCGFIINYHDDYEAADGGQELEATVQAQFDHSQYWLGLPLLITAFSSLCSALLQNRRTLTTVTIIFFHICILFSLFAMVLEGVDWVYWKNLDRERRTWEDKDGYECLNTKETCICQERASNGTLLGNKRVISGIATCSNITSLTGLFGAIVASAVIGIFLSLSGIVVVLKSLSWKPRHYYVEYDLSSANPVVEQPYKNEGFSNGAPPRMAGDTLDL